MRRPPEEPLEHEPRIFTATVSGTLDCPSLKHRAFSGLQMETTENIVGICSNYTAKFRPGFEYLRRTKKEAELAPAGRKKRAQEGDGNHLNSSITFHVRMSTKDENSDGHKMYNMKLFPYTGRVQLYGITDKDHNREALPVIKKVCEFLQPIYGKLPDVRDLAPIIINAKTKMNWINPHRQVFDLDGIMRLLETPEIKNSSPYPISSLQMSLDSDKLRIYFKLKPEENREANMILFVHGKVGIMASTSNEVTQRIYEFFRELLKKHWETITFIIPLPDYLWELRGNLLEIAKDYERIWMRLLHL